ncbi:MAG: hypothetical protein O3A46_15890, partial [Candidatus Poribacteria bacterium]|nr:hypothetical protein [Candidatus Poribacteria bacterium]
VGPPFPGNDGAFPNATHRIFEQDNPDWGWSRSGREEGHTRELIDGVNSMYMMHRQGNDTRLMDVFVWADSDTYVPTDVDYEGTQLTTAVEPAGKATTTWAAVKSARQ